MNTTYFLNLVAGNVFGSKKTPAMIDKYYLGLSRTAPDIEGNGVTEPSTDAGYKRVELKSLGEPTNGVITNTAPVNFDESTADWGTITHYVVYDSDVTDSGNLLMYGELPKSRIVESDTIMTVKEGYLKLAVQNIN